MKTLSSRADLMLRVGRANLPARPYKAAIFHGEHSLARDRLATLARADRIQKHVGGRCKGYVRGVATSFYVRGVATSFVCYVRGVATSFYVRGVATSFVCYVRGVATSFYVRGVATSFYVRGVATSFV